MRRFLYIPLIHGTSLNENEGFQEFFNFSTALMEAGEKAYWYIVLPSWVKDGMRSHKRIQYVYLNAARDNWVLGNIGYPAYELAQHFSRRGGRFIIDAVYTNCTHLSSYMSHVLRDPYRKNLVPVFIRGREFDIEELLSDKTDQWLRLVGDYVTCNAVLRSETERSLFFGSIANRSSSAIARVFDERSYSWPVGYNRDYVEGIVFGVKDAKAKTKVPMLFIGGDFNDGKGKRREIKIAKKLFAMGGAPTVIGTWSSRTKIDQLLSKGDASFIRSISSSLTLEAYHKTVASNYCFVSVANDYDVKKGEEEISRILYGQVGVFPYFSWTVSRLGKDYPFFYNYEKEEEAVLMAEWVVNNYEEASQLISETRDRLWAKHNEEGLIKGMWANVTSKIDVCYRVSRMKELEKGKTPLFQTIHKVAKGLGDEFSLDVFLDVMEEHLSWLKSFGRKGSLKVMGDVPRAIPTLYDLREMLDNLGWVDACDGPMIRIRKEREPNPLVFSEIIDG